MNKPRPGLYNRTAAYFYDLVSFFTSSGETNLGLIKPLNKSTNKSMFARMSGDFADMMLKKLTTAKGRPTRIFVSSNPLGF